METTASTGTVAQDPPIETSILRDGQEAARLRDRMERPARVGRLVLGLLGAVTASAGFATWVTAEAAVGLAVGAFGIVLIALGVVQHLLYRRDLEHWPDEAHLWTDGLEVVLHNGEVRGASWSDPDFALHLVARGAPPPANREYLLIWLTDAKVPPVELSAEGFDRVCRAAIDHGLRISKGSHGSRADGNQLLEIRRGRMDTSSS